MNRHNYKAALLLCIATLSTSTYATVVEVRTVEGDFQVNLFDEATPQTVENFLEYVNSGAYANNTVHRSATSFVIQMGGFAYNGAFPPEPINTGLAVSNEPELSNLRGTIAMAKIGGNPDSATSQFYVNLGDNSVPLDTDNGGFSVFGQVIGDGMDVVERIADLPRFNFGVPFNEIPLRDYSAADAGNGVVPDDSNVVIITDIVVIDSATVTNPDLNPTSNTLINAQPPTQPSPGSSGGGAIHVLLLLGLGLINVGRRWSSRKVKPSRR